MLPYRIGFSDHVRLWSFWFFFDLCVDIYFATDLVLNFRTAVVTSEGQLLYKQVDIARAYLKGWFTIDFMSCLPLSYMDYFVEGAGESDGQSRNRMVRLIRAFRLLKLLRRAWPWAAKPSILIRPVYFTCDSPYKTNKGGGK